MSPVVFVAPAYSLLGDGSNELRRRTGLNDWHHRGGILPKRVRRNAEKSSGVASERAAANAKLQHRAFCHESNPQPPAIVHCRFHAVAGDDVGVFRVSLSRSIMIRNHQSSPRPRQSHPRISGRGFSVSSVALLLREPISSDVEKNRSALSVVHPGNGPDDGQLRSALEVEIAAPLMRADFQASKDDHFDFNAT